jgi:hypothetical protein
MKRKTKALGLILGGPVLLVAVLVLYAISSFVVSAAADTGSDLAATVGTLISVALSVVGILAMLLVLIGIPLGIVLLATGKDESEGKDVYVYQSIAELTRNIIIVGVLSSVLSLLGILLLAMGFTWGVLLSLISMPISFIFSVAYLVWVYRAYANIIVKKKGDVTLSPGWAVGMHFIPGVNIVYPAFIYKQIWSASVGEDRAFLVLVWWFVVVGAVLALTYFNPTVDFAGSMLVEVAFLALLGIGLWMMHRVAKGQEKWA